jgi:ATP-dependent RNA helicase DDX49/DBP8
MAPKSTIHAGSATNTLREEASGSSDSDSEQSLHSAAETSDSDSLDSHASRKRRKVSPVEEHVPPLHTVSAPSRMKKKIQNVVNKEINQAVLAPTDPSTSFASLTVKPWLVKSLESMAIKRPTGIQKGCIPEILKGRDCIGGSRTGSGKTVAFAVPILQKWAEDPFGIFALILTPTRYIKKSLLTYFELTKMQGIGTANLRTIQSYLLASTA